MAAELVVVTGAGAGIGRALAHVFSDAGHPILLISRHLEAQPELKGKPVLYRKLDVSDADELGAAITDAESEFGPTGCLINNAGMLHIGGLESLSLAQVAEEVDTMITGVMNGIHHLLQECVNAKPARLSTSARSVIANPRRVHRCTTHVSTLYVPSVKA